MNVGSECDACRAMGLRCTSSVAVPRPKPTAACRLTDGLRRVAYALAVIAATFGSANATTNFTVNSTDDLRDNNPGDGVCSASTIIQVCTLRAAVMESNALPPTAGPFYVSVPAGEYRLTIDSDFDDLSAAQGDLDTDRVMSITGAGAALTVLRPGISSGLPLKKFESPAFEVFGAGRLELEDVAISGFSTLTEKGGATIRCSSLYQNGFGLSLKSVSMTSNEFKNGVISSFGVLCRIQIEDSLLANNRQIVASNMGSFPALINASQHITIHRTAILDNSKQVEGPIVLYVQTGPAILDDVTIAGNFWEATGAGLSSNHVIQLHSVQSVEPHVIRNSTIVDNVYPVSPNGTGGAHNAALSVHDATVKISNTILARNSDLNYKVTSSSGGFGHLQSAGHNLIGPGMVVAGGFTSDPTSVLDVVDPGLGERLPIEHPVPGWEGYTPLPGGLAHDKGSPEPLSDFYGPAFVSRCSTRDGAGVSRLVGLRCDIGAIEYFPPQWPFHALQTGDARDAEVGDGICSSTPDRSPATCTLRAAVMEADELFKQGHEPEFLVTLAPGDHELNIGPLNTTSPLHGDLDVAGMNLAVRGERSLATDASVVRIAAGLDSRIFEVSAGANLHLEDVELRDANISSNTFHGGGVYCSDSDVSILRAKFTNLQAISGGAVSGVNCALEVRDSHFSGNRADGGGAIWSQGILQGSGATISNSVFEGNEAKNGSAIYASILDLVDTTISHNRTLDGYGALVVAGGAARLRNMTLAFNIAQGPTPYSALTVLNSQLKLFNSIVSGNHGTDLLMGGTSLVSQESKNLIGSYSGVPVFANSLLGVGPGLLEPLTEFPEAGVPRWGHEPIPGGLAHDGGDASGDASGDLNSPQCSRFDQLGRDRHTPIRAGAACDVGAVEYLSMSVWPIFRDGFED